MNTIKIQFVGDSYIASIDDTWVDGRYESEADARIACDTPPDSINALWKQSLSAGKEGLITHEELTKSTEESRP